MSAIPAKKLSSSLRELNLNDSVKATKSKRPEPAESWEDDVQETDSSDTETESSSRTPASRLLSSDYPGAPPPTPASPSFSTRTTAKGSPVQTFPPYDLGGAFDVERSGRTSSPPRRLDDDKRPEKTTSVASRMIAAGIGQKAPKRTKEQREYDQAMKLQEKKKRDQAKEEVARKLKEKEKAVKAAWDD